MALPPSIDAHPDSAADSSSTVTDSPSQFPAGFRAAHTLVLIELFLAPACTALIGTRIDAPLAAVAVCLPQVAAAAWLVRTRWGVAVTLAAGLGWYLPRFTSGHTIDHSSAVLGTMVCLGFAMLAGRLRRTVRSAQRAAESDDLTQLLNRRGFHRCLEAESNRSLRASRPLAVAFLDCDGFKAINDTLGHAAGDRLLQAISRTLERNVRNYDSVARLGGDEFAILFPEMPPTQAQAVADRLVEAIETEMRARDCTVGVSMGVVVFERPGDINEMLAAADREMYSVKRSGKGRAAVRVISPTDTDGSSLEA